MLPGELKYETAQDTSLAVGVADGLLKGAIDVDVPKDQLAIEVPAAGTITAKFGGTVTPKADGSFTYAPQAGYSGQDMFDFTVTDGAAKVAGKALVTVGESHAPLALKSPAALTQADAAPSASA